MSFVLAGAAWAYPDAIVLRGRLERVKMQNGSRAVGAETNLGVTVSFYANAGTSVPLWVGETNVVVSADGRFQLWVSDMCRLKGSQGGDESLVSALTLGHATAYGLKFEGDEAELDPRTMLSTVPMVKYARNTLSIDDGGTVTGLVQTEHLNVLDGEAHLGTTVISNGIETTGMQNLTLQVDQWETTGTGGVTLKKSPGNRIFSSGRPIIHRSVGQLSKGTKLVGPKGSGALIETDRGGVVTYSYGRRVPCVPFFVNRGETFEMPFDVPEEVKGNDDDKRKCIGVLNLVEF